MPPEPAGKPEEVLPVPWEPPTLILVGSVAELVQGGGKSGPGVDGDPQNETKATPI